MPNTGARAEGLLTSANQAKKCNLKEKNMRWNLKASITTITLFAGLAVPVRLAAQEQAELQAENRKHSRYKLVDLGTLGGPSSAFNQGPSLNNHGMAVGASQTLIPIPPN